MKTPGININMPDVSDKTVKTLLLVGGGIALYFVGKKFLADKREDKADSQIDTNPAAGQSRALIAAMNPSGVWWLRQTDGTNEAAIYDVAKQITNLDDVKDFYRAQTHGRQLHEDLIQEISAQGYDKFLALATKGKSGSPKFSLNRTDVPANYWVITTASANVRKTPNLESKYSPFNNIVRLVPAGQNIGTSTGKYVYDEDDDVTFIEFYRLGAKKPGKHYYYVAKSQVELVDVNALREREAKSGKLPFVQFDGLSGTEEDYTTQAISRGRVQVYDEHLSPLLIADKNIIVGFPIMQLNTGKEIFVKVITVQGRYRWVKQKDIRIVKR